jgi:hypothetical protein
LGYNTIYHSYNTVISERKEQATLKGAVSLARRNTGFLERASVACASSSGKRQEIAYSREEIHC